MKRSINALFDLSSDSNQYGRYGKTRAEEDAKRYVKEKEELEKEKDAIRNTLSNLRQEKRELKEQLQTASGKEKKKIKRKENLFLYGHHIPTALHLCLNFYLEILQKLACRMGLLCLTSVNPDYFGLTGNRICLQ